MQASGHQSLSLKEYPSRQGDDDAAKCVAVIRLPKLWMQDVRLIMTGCYGFSAR